jgi:hypothetical protein
MLMIGSIKSCQSFSSIVPKTLKELDKKISARVLRNNNLVIQAIFPKKHNHRKEYSIKI